MSKRIVVCLTSRGNYARVGSVLHALDEEPNVELDIIVAGASMLRKYGTLSEMLEDDGLEITSELYNVIEGGNPVSTAKTTGLGMMEFASQLHSLEPDGVITIADRYETMAVTLAASYLNIPVLHVQGGELTGSIDDKVRHATTKLSDYHLVATEQSKEIVVRMGELDDRVHVTGCPSIDIAADINEESAEDDPFDPQETYSGVGSEVDVTDDYLVVQYHPVATEYQSQYDKTWDLIEAVDDLDVQAFWFWPNMDAGTNQVSKAIREFRDIRDPDDIRFYINMRPREYLRLVANSACLVGNSSVAIRECSYLGQPAVNIGKRQKYRERCENVVDVPCETEAITGEIRAQMDADEYPGSTLYGDGNAGERVRDFIVDTDLELKDAMHPENLDLLDAVPAAATDD